MDNRSKDQQISDQADQLVSQKKSLARQKTQIGEQADLIDAQDTEISDLKDQIIASKFDLPLLKIAENALMVPLVGAIDSVKSQKIMEDILNNIKNHGTWVVVLDVAGIKIVDSSVAAHLIKIAKAARLMGCRTIVSGFSPQMAQNIVNLGVSTDDIEASATLKDALFKAYQTVGYKLVKQDDI